MMFRSACAPAAALASMLVLACGGNENVLEPILELPRQLSAAEQEVIRNTNAFGFDLFARVHAVESGPNVFLSPLSASMALGMLANGAAGDTWEGMRDALRFQDLSAQQINESYRGLMDLLLDLDSRVTVQIGNSVWSRQGVPFEQTFMTTVSDYFDAEARELDFDDPSTLDIINGWASDATNGRIDRVLDEIRPDHIMFLLNAIYFKGKWERQFNPADTRQAPFTREDGSQVSVPMMSLREPVSVPFAYTPDYQAIELAYGGKAYAMVIVLPAPGGTLSSVVQSLDAQAWNGLVDRLDSASVQVQIPRFRLKYEELLNQPLMDMGMGEAFGRRADFTPLTPLARDNTVCINFVKQNTFVEMNEEGTEAAAVTSVGVSVTSAPPSFTVDRPFLFVIRERLSGTILFMGAIGDPTREESEVAASPPPPCE
jgi:serine protease inhibitor